MIAVGIVFLPVGFTVVLIALVVLAVPPILTNAYVGVSEIDTETVEAARGMGMTERQILQRIELPLAAPLLFAGIRTQSSSWWRLRRSRRSPEAGGSAT